MLCPIEGASYVPLDKIWAMPQTATVNGRSGSYAQGFEALQVRNQVTRAAEGMAQVGIRQAAQSYEALAIGFTATTASAVGRFTQALQAQAIALRPADLSLVVNQQRPALAAIGAQALTIGSSRTSRGPSFLALLLRGAVKTKSPAMGLTTRGTRKSSLLAAAEIEQTNLRAFVQAVALGGHVERVVRLGGDIRTGESFLILADLVDAGLAQGPTGSGYFPAQEVVARLTINGSVWPIRSFQYSAPRGTLGATLNIRLAIPTTAPANLAIGLALTFEIGVKGNDGVLRWKALVQDGRIAGRQINISFRSGTGNQGPADEISISAFDILHDRFGLAPRQPVTMYDPFKVSYREVEVRPTDALRAANGAPILPSVEPVAGLSAYDVMSRAYLNRPGPSIIRLWGAPPPVAGLTAIVGRSAAVGAGLGFAQFVTNIPNYQVSRADFSVAGGWHEGAAPFFSMYGPLYFTASNILFIVDSKMALPPNFTPRRINVSTYANLGLTNEPTEQSNACILTLKLDAAEVLAESGIYFTYRFDQETAEPGPAFGEPGYIRQEVQRKVREMRSSADPGVILAEQIEQTITKVYQNLVLAGDGSAPVMLTHRETQQDFYDGLLKTSYDKQVEGLIISGFDASFELVEISREKGTITWKDDPANPGQVVQARTWTQVDGLFVTVGETRQIMGADGVQHDSLIRYPVMVAQANGLLTEADAIMHYAPIKTIEEQLVPTKGAQVDMLVREYDHLTGTVKTSITQARTGSRYPGDMFSAKQRSFLLRDLDSEALIGPRKPLGINAGELPRLRAFDLGYKVIKYSLNPPETLRLNIPGVDFSIERGTVVSADLRVGVTNNFMVAGYDIVGENLGLQGHRISMSCDGVEIIT